MAKKVKKGTLTKKLGRAGKKAFDEVKDNEVRYSTSGELPAGIEGGIAQLSECKFDTYKTGDNKGEYYFYAAGIVQSPKSIRDSDGNEIWVQGGRTQIGPEPLCETEGRARESLQEHFDWICNELKKLGAEELSYETIEETVEALKEEAPFFRFRTWKGEPTEQYKNPRTNHIWNGVKGLEDYEPPEDDEVDENEEEDEDAEEDDEEAEDEPEEGDEDEEEEDEDEEEDEGGDDDEDDEDEGDEDDEDEDAVEPEKGEAYMYKPPRKRKMVQVEITAVSKKKRTCSVKDDDGKIYKNVSWDELSYEE